MKKFVFWAMMTLGVVGLQSCDKDDDDRLQVSANLQEAFDTRYPNVSRVDWEQKGQFYEAEFADNGYENKAWFTPDGVWVMTEYDIPFAQLPQTVQDAFKTGAYASWRVDDVDKIEKTDASVIYVIEVESGEKEYELTYLEDGTLIREEAEWGEHTFETETGNYYRIEVEDRGADKYVYVAENGEMLQMKLKNYA